MRLFAQKADPPPKSEVQKLAERQQQITVARRDRVRETANWIYQDMVECAGDHVPDHQMRRLADIAVRAGLAFEDALDEAFPTMEATDAQR